MTPLPCPCGRGMRAVLRDHAGAPVRLADRCKTCSAEAFGPRVCPSRMGTYECALPAGHLGKHQDEGRFTIWPDEADTRPTITAACEDCADTGTITDPAPDAPGARPPEPCVSCPPPRTLPVTPAERALAACLRAWLSFRESPWQSSPVTEALVRIGSALKIAGVLCGTLGKREITPTGAALLARVEAAERTPETVLRAMLVSYEADAIEKARAYYADPGVDASLLRATNEADTDVEIVRDQLAILLAKGFTTFTVSMSTIGADYAARLAGTTPLDAPPAKEPR